MPPQLLTSQTAVRVFFLAIAPWETKREGYGGRETEREKERDTQIRRETERGERQREGETDRETKREREIQS